MNKSEILKYCQKLWQKATPYFLNPDDLEIVIPLLKIRKRDYFEPIVIKSDKHHKHSYQNCFYYLTDNHEWNDFSVYKALDGNLDKSLRIEAFRLAIRHQIQEFREQTQCFDGVNYHVDHIIPFSCLLNNFLAINDISLDDVEIKSMGYKQGQTIADKFLKNFWVYYHQKEAKLQILSAKENLKKGSQNLIDNFDEIHLQLIAKVVPNTIKSFLRLSARILEINSHHIIFGVNSRFLKDIGNKQTQAIELAVEAVLKKNLTVMFKTYEEYLFEEDKKENA